MFETSGNRPLFEQPDEFVAFRCDPNEDQRPCPADREKRMLRLAAGDPPLQPVEPIGGPVFAAPAHPQRLRQIAAAGALILAAVYGLIATDVITVLEDQATASPAPPLVAAVAFTILAFLLLISPRRGVLLFGVVLQAMSIAVYLMVSARRVPAFEAWGIGLKVAQLLLLALFVWLLRAKVKSPPIPQPTGTFGPAHARVSDAESA